MRNKRRMLDTPVARCCLLLLAGFAAVAPLQAQPVFKWVDAKGRTHYSDTAPVDQAFQRLDALPELNLLPSDALENFPPQLQRTKIKSQPTAILLNPDGAAAQVAGAEAELAENYAPVRYSYLPVYHRRAHHCTGLRCRLKPRIPEKRKFPHLGKKPLAAETRNYTHIKPVGFDTAGRQPRCRHNCEPAKPLRSRLLVR